MSNQFESSAATLLTLVERGFTAQSEPWVKRPPNDVFWETRRTASPRSSPMLFANSIPWNRRKFEPDFPHAAVQGSKKGRSELVSARARSVRVCLGLSCRVTRCAASAGVGVAVAVHSGQSKHAGTAAGAVIHERCVVLRSSHPQIACILSTEAVVLTALTFASRCAVLLSVTTWCCPRPPANGFDVGHELGDDSV